MLCVWVLLLEVRIAIHWVLRFEGLGRMRGSNLIQGCELLVQVRDSVVLAKVQLPSVQVFEVLLSVHYSSRGLYQMRHSFCLEVRNAEGLRLQLWDYA